jgi:hypothetical protein
MQVDGCIASLAKTGSFPIDRCPREWRRTANPIADEKLARPD